jgi:hypothetical protein
MKATSSTQHSFVISLLQEGYSVRQIQSKTGLGKSTVGRIKKEMDEDKEIMMEVVQLSFLLRTRELSFTKSLLADWIMQFRVPSTSTTSSPIQYILKQSEMLLKRVHLGLL